MPTRPDREQFLIDRDRREFRDQEREPVVALVRIVSTDHEADRREAIAMRFAKCFVTSTGGES